MKIRILYFALLRDALGRAQEELEVPEDVTTVAGPSAPAGGSAPAGSRMRLRSAMRAACARPSIRRWPSPTTP